MYNIWIRKGSTVAQYLNGFYYFPHYKHYLQSSKSKVAVDWSISLKTDRGRGMHGFYFIGLFFLNQIRREKRGTITIDLTALSYLRGNLLMKEKEML